MHLTRLVCLGLVLTLTLPAAADTLRPGTGKYGHITRINKGVAELGLDNILIVRSNSEKRTPEAGGDATTTSTLSAIFVGGPTVRYFIIDNLSLSANINLDMVHTSSKTETGAVSTEDKFTEFGFLATVMADYYLSLGRGMFIKPGLGGGYFLLSGSKPIEVAGQNNVKVSTKRSGGVGRFQLSLVFYTSQNFNLKAGVDVLARFGSKTEETDGTESKDTISLLEIDSGWNVGFSYVF